MSRTPFYILAFNFSLLIALAACQKDEEAPFKSAPELFDEVWTDFDRTYPYFIHKNIDWDSVKTVYESRISEGTSQSKLFDILGEMTLVLRDVHVDFKSSYGYYHYSKSENYPPNPPDNASTYLLNTTINNSKCVFGRVADRHYYYLRIRTFGGDVADYAEAVNSMDSLHQGEGLIIDIRSNGGGNELVGRSFAGRFVDTGKLYKYTRQRSGDAWDSFTGWNESFLPSNNYLETDKPVILLCNRSVYSSSELFMLMMKTYPHLIIVGDTSGGASANPVQRSMSNGWKYRVSRWQAADLNYQLIEDNGIAPDHYVLMTETSIDEGKDLILERAIELLDMHYNRLPNVNRSCSLESSILYSL